MEPKNPQTTNPDVNQITIQMNFNSQIKNPIYIKIYQEEKESEVKSKETKEI